MIDEPQGQATQQPSSEGIEITRKPAHILASVHPDQNITTWLDRTGQLTKRRFRFGEMVDDPNRKRDIEVIFFGNVVNGLIAHFDRGIGRKIFASRRKGPIVDIERDTTCGALQHRPMSVATDPAAGVENLSTFPDIAGQCCGPAYKLFAVLGKDFRKNRP